MRLIPAAWTSALRGKSVTAMSSPSLAQLLASVFAGGGATKSGATVTPETALQVTAVLCCVRVLAEGVAQVPWQIMRQTTNQAGRVTRRPALQHPLYRLLWRKPNPWQTSFGLRETMVIHAALTGRAYAFKSRVGSRIAQLVVLPPERVRPEMVDGDTRIVYHVKGRNGQEWRTLTEDDVWHWRGPSWDGLEGMNIVRIAREAIGLSAAAEETQANLHGKGVRTSGTYSVEGALDPKQYEQLKTWIAKEFGGAANAGLPLILDRNAKWMPNQMSGVDAQHLETRRHQIEEICRAFRVLPAMAMQQDKATTYASAEQMAIWHLVHSLMPWYERIEQSADCQLLTDSDLDQGYYTLLDGTGLLRGALKDTAEFISKLTERGVMTRNEARAYLDLNPLDGLDEPLTPVNLAVAGAADPAAAADA
jgi:HK97 family phage portal protein